MPTVKKLLKKKNSSTHRKKHIFANKGFSALFVIVVVAIGIFLAGAFESTQTLNPVQVMPDPNSSFANPTGKESLQLRTIGFISITPSPTTAPTNAPASPPVKNANCQGISNTEPAILVGSDPAPSGIAQSGGKLRLWVNDEGAPKIAPNEQVNTSNGQITSPGDRTANDGGNDNHSPGGHRIPYIWEPALYITLLTAANQNGPYSGDAENGGALHAPSLIKGEFNNSPTNNKTVIQSIPIDPDYINFENGPDYLGKPPITNLPEQYTAEYIWDINSLGLTPGLYRIEEVVHDGDSNLAINCVELQI